MKKRIKALAEGNFEYEPIELRVSVDRIEEMVYKDGVLQGSFFLESADARKIQGVIYTSDSRMKCIKEQFSGRKVEIPYEFHSFGMEENDTNKGEIYIESNAGEYVIPYVVTIEVSYTDTSLGKIRNLFHVANLAQINYAEACRLFASKEFGGVLMDAEQKLLYESLGGVHASKANLEEFLTAVHKKQPVTFQIAKTKVHYISEGESFQKDVLLTKSGWGQLNIQVKTRDRFINPTKSVITEEDFVGNNCMFEFVIDERWLHAGSNFGLIEFITVDHREILEIEVKVPLSKEQANERRRRQEIRKLEIRLGHLYFDVRDKAIHNNNWIKESLLCVENILALGVLDDWYVLLRAQFLAMSKNGEEAGRILEQYESRKRILRNREPQLYAYLQYVTALYRQEPAFTSEVLEEVKSIGATYKDSFRMVWIRLFMDEELNKNPIRKHELLKEQFDLGCRSPYLYMEAFLVLQSNEDLFTHLGEFEVCVLNFALRQAILNESLAQKVAQLSLNLKNFEPRVYKLVSACYYMFELEICVEAICSMLIRADMRQTRCFEWFERGVACGLKITRLFEYYMYTLPRDKKKNLPKTLLMYFQYDNFLDYDRKSILYVDVLKRRDEFPDLVDSYKPQMDLFVLEQVVKGHISEELAYLYEYFLDDILRHEETRDIYERLIFTADLTCDNEKIVKVIVKHEQLKQEEEYPIRDGHAMIRHYTSNAGILLEDINGDRHFNIPYKLQFFFAQERISQLAEMLDKEHLGILLYCYQKMGVVLQSEHLHICEKLLGFHELKPEFCLEILKKLIYYYQNQEDSVLLERALKRLNFSIMDRADRSLYLEIMIYQGMYDDAYEVIQQFGPEGIRVKSLVRLCSRRIQSSREDKELLELCYFVFSKGKYNEVVLEYLTRYFYGSIWQLHELWSAAKRFNIEYYDLCERILVQMLFTGYLLGDSDEIFEDYRKGISNHLVLMAYLSYFSYHYVVHNQVVSDKLSYWIMHEYQDGGELNDICLIALLKNYAGEKYLPDTVVNSLQKILDYFLSREIYLSFFGELDEVISRQYRLMEKTMIEYQTNPKNQVFLHYRIVNNSQESKAYVTVPMKPAFSCIYVKDLTLFYDEVVQYYIVEKRDVEQNAVITRSAIKENQYEIGRETDGRYVLLNEMAISHSMKEEVTLISLMEKYIKMEKIVEKMFELK